MKASSFALAALSLGAGLTLPSQAVHAQAPQAQALQAQALQAQALQAQVAQAVMATPYVINGAEQFTLKSKTNGREYQIFVSAPQGDPQSPIPTGGYPVIYATDGNAMFPQLLATANLLRATNRAIIVGIGYPGAAPFDTSRRYYDLTPKTSEEAIRASGRGANAQDTGGNDLFLEFLETELKPLIEARYKVDKGQQTLFGHSLGGLFTLHALFARPGTFQNYVAAAPSIWWNRQSVLNEEKAFVAAYKAPQSPIKVLITGNEDPNAQPPAGAVIPTPPNGGALTGRPQDGVSQGQTVVADLSKLNGIKAESRVFANETHISMVPSSVTAALRFVLGDAPRGERQGGQGPIALQQ